MSPASPAASLADLLQALEVALLALEDDQLRAPSPRLVALLARRRRSVLMLRKQLRGSGMMRRHPRRPHLTFDELIATEFKLARMVDANLAVTPESSHLRRMLTDLRAEVDEAALSLRLIAQHRN